MGDCFSIDSQSRGASNCSMVIATGCSATDMQPTMRSPASQAASRSHSPSAGRICAASSTIAKQGHAPVASEALERIAKRYVIEKTMRGRSAEERRIVRQQRSKPLVTRSQVLVRTPTHASCGQIRNRRGHPLGLPSDAIPTKYRPVPATARQPISAPSAGEGSKVTSLPADKGMEPNRPLASVTSEHPSHVRVATASLIGTAIEWYDFFLYGTAAG
jgi:hypothetical protein